MDQRCEDRAAQDEFVASRIDPIVRRVLATSDPHDAYWAVGDITNALQEDTQLPDWGSMYVAWSELADVFVTGRTPQADAHTALRGAAVEWLERPLPASDQFFESWAERATAAVQALYARDGDFWTVGEIAGRPYWLPVDGGGRVGVRLGDGLPIFEAALRDCFGARPEGGQVEAVRNRVERAINRLEVDPGKGDRGPWASGSLTFLRVVNGRVEAGYLRDPEDGDSVETVPVEEVMALLVAWRRTMLRRVAGEATRPRALKPPAPRRSAAGGFWAWLLGT